MRIVLSVDHLLDVQADIVVLPLLAQERPLRGAIGWVDWHEMGALSRLIQVGYFNGGFEEQVLYAPRPHFRVPKMLLVGMGDRVDFTYYRLFKLYRAVGETLIRLKVKDIVLGLPGDEKAELDLPRVAERMISGVVDGVWSQEEFLKNTTLILSEAGSLREEIYIMLQHLRVELKERVALTVLRQDQRSKYGARPGEPGESVEALV